MFVAQHIRGGIRDCLHHHLGHKLTPGERGTIIGSASKRALNSLLCDQGRARLKQLLDEADASNNELQPIARISYRASSYLRSVGCYRIHMATGLPRKGGVRKETPDDAGKHGG